MRIDCRASMGIQIGPLDSFTVIEIRKTFSCHFPDKKGYETNDSNTACH